MLPWNDVGSSDSEFNGLQWCKRVHSALERQGSGECFLRVRVWGILFFEGLFGFLLFVECFGCSCVLRGALRFFNKTLIFIKTKKVVSSIDPSCFERAERWVARCCNWSSVVGLSVGRQLLGCWWQRRPEGGAMTGIFWLVSFWDWVFGCCVWIGGCGTIGKYEFWCLYVVVEWLWNLWGMFTSLMDSWFEMEIFRQRGDEINHPCACCNGVTGSQYEGAKHLVVVGWVEYFRMIAAIIGVHRETKFVGVLGTSALIPKLMQQVSRT